MTFDELLKLAAAEPPRTEKQEVVVPTKALLDKAHGPGGVRVTDLLSDPTISREPRTVRTAHIFGPPASAQQIAEWKRMRPSHPLPDDLEGLLLRANGIHLWAEADTGRSYEGLAPLEEWDLARDKMWGPGARPEMLSDEYVAISYHTDGAAFVVLKTTTGEYFLMDSCGADESCLIGRDVGALLSWLWNHRA